MVSREDMTNAIALNSTMFNHRHSHRSSHRWVGLRGCRTCSVLPHKWCVLHRGDHCPAADEVETVRASNPGEQRPGGCGSGFRYVRTNLVARTAITNLAVVSLFGISFVSLMPAWAVKVLGGDATTNGFLLSGRGVGALLGGLMLASISGFVVRGRMVTLGASYSRSGCCFLRDALVAALLTGDRGDRLGLSGIREFF